MGGHRCHAGVRDYTVYVSQNGGPFTLFIQNTTDTSRVLNGVVGSTYRFYSIARDRAGNIEGAKTLAEATVTIVSVVTPPPVPGNMSGSGFVEPAGTKWHFVFGAGAGTSSLQVWANGPGKRFIATSASALFLDTSNVRLSGTGTWNGVGGYTFEATASERGEPGKNNDRFSFVIGSGGNIIATADATLAGGNIQSKR